MSKLIYVLVAMFILNIALATFTCSDWDTSTGQCTSTDPSDLIYFLNDPSAVSATDIWTSLFGSVWGLAAVLAVGAVTVGSIFFRSEAPIFIAASLGLITTAYPSIKLWQLINGLSTVGDSLSRGIIAGIVVGTMILTVLFTILDWARGKE